MNDGWWLTSPTTGTGLAAVTLVPNAVQHNDELRNSRRRNNHRAVPRAAECRSSPVWTGRRVVRRVDRRYPSDLTDRQWQRVQSLLPRTSHRGRPPSTDLRAVVNAINYRWRCGCTWRMLPHDFPPWETVYMYFHNWRRTGLLPTIRDVVLHRDCGRNA